LAAKIGFQEIPLGEVDLDDYPFALPTPPDLSRLRASIQEVGLLSPLWLRCRPREGWQLVAGSKRLKAMAQLGWERVPARTLPAGSPDSHCLLVSLYDNAFSRGFNLWEQALYAVLLLKHWDRETVVAKFLPYLGLPPAYAHLDRLLALATLEEPFKLLSAQGRLALTAGAYLAEWQPEDRAAAWPFLSELHWSQSKQEEFLENLVLLARREGASPARILSRPELRKYLSKDAGTPAERVEALRRLLKRQVSPRLSAAQDAFQAALSRLGLGNHPRFRLKAPPAFEGPDFHLEIKFRDAPELQKLLEELTRRVSREEFPHLTRL
jgi:ParB-like chromosome segregation protein Spo0J